jgi:hypothetical protein
MAVASVLTLNVILIILSLVIAGILVAFYKLHYLVDSFVFKRTNFVQVLDGCELSGDRTTAIRKVGSKFSATAAALLQSNSNESIDKEKVESIVINSHCAFKFVMQVEKLDINKLLDRLQTKRNMKEIELSRLKNVSKESTPKINNVKRQIEQIEHEIEVVSTGGTPLKVAQYIMTSSISESRFGAQEGAKSQLRELAGEFGALLGTKSQMLMGNELVDLLKFDSVIR